MDTSLTILESVERGGEVEMKFHAAMSASGYGAPRWYHGINRASREQDRNGVDAFAILDVGEVPVQIKGSHAGREQHLRQYGDVHCIIVVCAEMSLAYIRTRAFNLLYQWRGRLLLPRTRQNSHRRPRR